MSHRVRRPVIAGNWKMNLGPANTRSFFEAFTRQHAAQADRTVVFFPPTLSFAAAADAVHSRPDIALGVQNIHWEAAGAFTGEVSAAMAAEAGAAYVLAGHSERRHIFHDTDEQVGRKAAAALSAGLIPIACVGEKLDERNAGALRDVLLRQLDAVLDAVPANAGSTLLIAYEPVWAIGTGVNATPADASEAHAILRERLRECYAAEAADIPILYGGSVKADNASALLGAEGVDGLLVGGASLDPAVFARIAAA